MLRQGEKIDTRAAEGSRTCSQIEVNISFDHHTARYLQVAESKWFSMNADQRSKHMSNVHSVTLSDVQELCEDDLTVSSNGLSVDAQSASRELKVPATCVQGIWRKAADLIRDPNSMVAAPGQSAESRMVLSYSGKAPHMVTPKKGGGFSCDATCPNWKSIGFCPIL